MSLLVLRGFSVALQRNPQLLNKLGKLFKALFSLSDLLSPHFILLSPNFNSDALDILNFQVLKEVLFPPPLSLWTALPAAWMALPTPFPGSLLAHPSVVNLNVVFSGCPGCAFRVSSV